MLPSDKRELLVSADEDAIGQLLPTARPRTALVAETPGTCLFISRVAFQGPAQHHDLAVRLAKASFFTCPDTRVFAAYLKVQDWERFRDAVTRGASQSARQRRGNMRETLSPMPLRGK